VLSGLARAAAIVDADQGDAAEVGTVDHDSRQPAPQD
jgi:hypothetical protein